MAEKERFQRAQTSDYLKATSTREAAIQTFEQKEKSINAESLARQRATREATQRAESAIGGTLSEKLRSAQSTREKRAIRKTYQAAKEEGNKTGINDKGIESSNTLSNGEAPTGFQIQSFTVVVNGQAENADFITGV